MKSLINHSNMISKIKWYSNNTQRKKHNNLYQESSSWCAVGFLLSNMFPYGIISPIHSYVLNFHQRKKHSHRERVEWGEMYGIWKFNETITFYQFCTVVIITLPLLLLLPLFMVCMACLFTCVWFCSCWKRSRWSCCCYYSCLYFLFSKIEN